MNQIVKGTIIKAQGIIQGLAYVTEAGVSEALVTACEMIDAALTFGWDPNLRTFEEYRMDWIKASEMLPEENEVVLALVDGNPKTNIRLKGAYFIAEYSDDEGWIIDGHEDWSKSVTVTHWRKLPAPPRKEGGLG